MNKTTTKNIVSLFLHCQKLIQNPKRLGFSDLKALLSPVLDETSFNKMAESIFKLSDHYFLLEKYKHPITMLIDINKLADQIKDDTNPTQKLVFINLLMKLVAVNEQQSNLHLDKAIYCIGEIFNFSPDQITSIKRLYFEEKLTEADYADSLLLTNQFPDYNQVVDGLRVIYNPDFRFRIWIKNIRSVNNMFFKILEFDYPESLSGIKVGDVLTYTRSLQSILDDAAVTLHKLSAKIPDGSKIIPRIEIPATERTPKILLNQPENRLEIEGVAMATDPQEFFKPVFYWLEKMKMQNLQKMDLHLNLSFFNTNASKVILKLMQKVLELESPKCKPKFYWYFEMGDDDMKESGEHYSSIIRKDFNFIETGHEELISA